MEIFCWKFIWPMTKDMLWFLFYYEWTDVKSYVLSIWLSSYVKVGFATLALFIATVYQMLFMDLVVKSLISKILTSPRWSCHCTSIGNQMLQFTSSLLVAVVIMSVYFNCLLSLFYKTSFQVWMLLYLIYNRVLEAI